MSVDRYDREYHLTPVGWQVGTFYYYGKAKTVVPPPPDRVLTMVKEVEQSSGWSPEEISWREDWRSTDAKIVGALLKKFGERPKKG
jgi:hypothetical protein